MSHTKFDIFVGTTSGIIKGLKIGQTKKENKIKNLQKVSIITETDNVTRIAWGDDDREILVACSAYKDNKVKIFDTESGVLKDWFPCNIGTDKISGISRYGRSILTSVKSGEICLWTAKKGEVLIKTEHNLNRMCHSHEHTNLIATGGEADNRLRVYDLDVQKSIFSAKNLSHDWLSLRRTIPISDINFLPGNLPVTVSKYGNIHLYDPRSQRRPVIDMTVQDEAWTCLDIAPKEKHIIVGSTKGKLNLVDLRKPGTVLNTYKGFIGGVTGVACSKTNPYVASVSLDRYLRIHHIHTKECLKSIYLTLKLSCLVMRSDICIEMGYENGTEN
ncbi:PREDICTED: WD repeat-containing protein 74 [Cyphomyrmex costatus]|uniref:WD repeat-containing protein 74 n=1 Tax=Cyphomyrmex costatus TaxID=456900 RepID=A0A195CKX9_9HYME|nr:PREDICTED: WD repeat-containing protein 74 [Cyphomyrmex costatus]KYN00734.1 WD repeat-containing protein 74 [Cyphomyrmex costatus]